MSKYLTEAFKSMNILDEDTFSVTPDSLERLDQFLNGDTVVEPELIIDPEAETEEELQDTYVGKVILNCPVCESKIYKAVADVIVDEESDLVNVGEECPYCQTIDGFEVVGQIDDFNPEEVTDSAETEETTEEETNESLGLGVALGGAALGAGIATSGVAKAISNVVSEEVGKCEHCGKPLSDNGTCPVCDEGDEEYGREKNESLKDLKKKRVTKNKSTKETPIIEAVNNVNVETDDSVVNVETDEEGKVTVTTENKPTDSEGDTIVPLSDETKDEILAPEESEESIQDDETVDVELDEFDEKESGEFVESYLKKVYENVKSYKITRGKLDGNKMIFEGIITFNSGKKSKTNFIFESHTITKTGKVKFTGQNPQISKNKKAFTLTGKMQEGKMITESFTYNYLGKDAKTNKSQRVYGTISKRK